jgi:hypothetical protein
MTDLKYDYLFDEYNNIIYHSKADNNKSYRIYPNEPLIYGYKKPYERKDNVSVRGHFFLKSNNPMFAGTNESPEHYNAKMKILHDKKYYDTIFKKWIEFDKVEVEKQVEGNKRPDVLCYIGGELVCIIEIFYTNEKTQEDIEKLKLNNVPVIEINIKNANSCRHLILPALLESNRGKYNELTRKSFHLRDKYKEFEYEQQQIELYFECEIGKLQEKSAEIFRRTESEIKKIKQTLSGSDTTTKFIKEQIKQVENKLKLNRRKIKRIENQQTLGVSNISDIESRIARFKLEITTIENQIASIAKNCKIEWFRNKWMTGPIQNKVQEINYWIS